MSDSTSDSSSTDGIGELAKAGYLVKSPRESRARAYRWRRRWFILMDSKLVWPLAERYVRLKYYRTEADAKRFADPLGNISSIIYVSRVSSQVSQAHYKLQRAITSKWSSQRPRFGVAQPVGQIFISMS